MSAGITVQQAQDLIVSTLPKMPRGEWVDTFKYQAYPFLEAASNDDVRKSGGGWQWQKRVRLRENLSARGVDLYEVTPTFRVPVMDYSLVNWCHQEAKVPYDARELAMNTSEDENQIIEWLATQRAGEMESLANLLEEWAFLPPVSATDTKNGLAGIPFWVRPLLAGITDPTFGFNGITAQYRNGATTTAPGGIDASLPENNRARNGTGLIRGMNPAAIRMIRTALRRVRFRPPPIATSQKGATTTQARFKLYMSQQMADDYDDLRNSGSDPRRGDVSPSNNEDMTIRGVPIEPTPVLDTVSYQPIYGINHRHLYMVTLKGQWMRNHKPMQTDNPNVYVEQIDCSCNIFCDNPRSCFVLHLPR